MRKTTVQQLCVRREGRDNGYLTGAEEGWRMNMGSHADPPQCSPLVKQILF